MSKPTTLSRDQLIAALDGIRAEGAGIPDRLLKALSVNRLDDLPENLRKIFASFKDGVDAFLGKLPPTEQIPAALDTAWALNQVSEMFQNTIGLWTSITQRFSEFEHSQNELTATSRNAVTALETKLATEYVLKADAEAAARTAAETAVTAYQAQCARTAQRQGELSKNGLPGAPENVIALDDEAFKTEVAACGERVKKLGAVGVSLNTHPESVKLAAWNDAECDRVLLYARESASQKQASHNAAPARSSVNPLAGGGTDPAKARKIIVA